MYQSNQNEYPEIMEFYHSINDKISDYSLMISSPLNLFLEHQKNISDVMAPLGISLSEYTLSPAVSAQIYSLLETILSDIEKEKLPSDFISPYLAVLKMAEDRPTLTLKLMLATIEILITLFSFYWDVNYTDENAHQYSQLLYRVQQLLELEQSELEGYKASIKAETEEEG